MLELCMAFFYFDDTIRLIVTEKEQKTAFAAAILKNPGDPFSAALSVIPNTGLALQAAQKWLDDEFVKSEKIRLVLELGEKSFLPTKEDQLRDVYSMAKDEKLDADIRLKAHRLYAEMQGNIEKPAQGGNTTQILAQNVMIVRDHGTDDDWENNAVNQQRELIGHATAH
jgi:uncharacterized protein with NAD-binding domain and iron-sulfur cluster